MLQLHGTAAFEGATHDHPGGVIKLTTAADRPLGRRRVEAFLSHNGEMPDGFGTYITFNPDAKLSSSGSKLIVLPETFRYLADGDVIRISSKKNSVRVLYRRRASANYFLVTERCNHYCLMCSQPPKDVDDSWLVEEILQVVPLIDPNEKFLGLSGGEPTLLGDQFLRILQSMKSYLPRTSVHVLSNGRRFADDQFTGKYAAVEHPFLTIGIPLYSDVSDIHDYVVQAPGAFDETIRGILNLKRYGQKVELRVVVHKQTYNRLRQLSEFIFRNLTFVDHVTFMGLEITGFTRANLDALWIDPFDYREELRDAVLFLSSCGITTSIYNHQLCTIDPAVHSFAKRSISDWKNEYIDQCQKCGLRNECGGFFTSARLKRSAHISAFPNPNKVL
jgi:His-Xaa-Ser system radical SAM maturase HxsC